MSVYTKEETDFLVKVGQITEAPKAAVDTTKDEAK
jgi:hypothetical protein